MVPDASELGDGLEYPCALTLYLPLFEEPEEISTRLPAVQWNVAGAFELQQEGIKRASRGQPKPLELRSTLGQIVGSDLKFEALKRISVYSHLLFSTVSDSMWVFRVGQVSSPVLPSPVWAWGTTRSPQRHDRVLSGRAYIRLCSGQLGTYVGRSGDSPRASKTI